MPEKALPKSTPNGIRHAASRLNMIQTMRWDTPLIQYQKSGHEVNTLSCQPILHCVNFIFYLIFQFNSVIIKFNLFSRSTIWRTWKAQEVLLQCWVVRIFKARYHSSIGDHYTQEKTRRLANTIVYRNWKRCSQYQLKFRIITAYLLFTYLIIFTQ